MSQIKVFFKRYLPEPLTRIISLLFHPRRAVQQILNKRTLRLLYEEKRRFHLQALSGLQYKKPIRCVFLALFDSVWKYDRVYQLMEKSDRFEPIILVCPIVKYGKSNMIENMARCLSMFRDKKYNVICAYDEQTDKYIDVKKDLAPDIIFYTSPYKGLIDDRYYIDNFDDTLTVYVPYFFNSNKDYNLSFNLPLHNLVWRRYVETDMHMLFIRQHSINKGINAVVSGFPGIDEYMDPCYTPSNIWKYSDHSKKRIIWAPHHTITPVGIIYYSCFLKYCSFMLSMAEKYKDKIEMVFKPHPLLKNKLYELWGINQTDSYYKRWEEGSNTGLIEGEYVDLFLTSDAMIHDSASFTIEYLYVNKPVLRTLNGEDLKEQFNKFGIECLKNHYKANTEQEIELFIQNVVKEIDPMKEKRSSFLKKTLLPKESPSQLIINDILVSIDTQRL